MSPTRTRAYRGRQRVQQEAAAAAVSPSPPAIALTTGPSTPGTPMPRDTSRPPIRKIRSRSSRFFHFTAEDDREHTILVDPSPIGVVVQPRPRQSSSKGSTSSSCMVARDKHASLPPPDLETIAAPSFDESAEICPRPRRGRQRCLVRALTLFWRGFRVLNPPSKDRLPAPHFRHISILRRGRAQLTGNGLGHGLRPGTSSRCLGTQEHLLTYKSQHLSTSRCCKYDHSTPHTHMYIGNDNLVRSPRHAR